MVVPLLTPDTVALSRLYLAAETAEEEAVVKAEMVLEVEGLFVVRKRSDEFL